MSRAYRRTKYIDKKHFRKGRAQRYVKFYTVTSNVKQNIPRRTSSTLLPYRLFFLSLFFLVMAASFFFLLGQTIQFHELTQAGRALADTIAQIEMPTLSLPNITITVPEISLPYVPVREISTAIIQNIITVTEEIVRLLNPLPLLLWIMDLITPLVYALYGVGKIATILVWNATLSLLEILNPRPYYVVAFRVISEVFFALISGVVWSAQILSVLVIAAIQAMYAVILEVLAVIVDILRMLDPRPFLSSIWQKFLEFVLILYSYYKLIEPYLKIIATTIAESFVFLEKGLKEMATASNIVLKYSF